MPRTGRGRGTGDESPMAPPIPSFASLRAPRRSSPAMDVLAPPPVPAELPAPAPVPMKPPAGETATPRPAQPPAPPGPAAPAAPRPAEWPDLLFFGVRVATAALRLPGVLVCAPVRRLRRLLGE